MKRKTKKQSTTHKSKSKGLPFILLLVLLGIMLYGFLKINNLTGPLTSKITTPPVVQSADQAESMDNTMTEIEESMGTRDTNLSESFVGL